MKLNFKQSWLNLLKMANAHKPELLTGTGTALMILAVPLAVAATVETCKKVEERKREVAQEMQMNSDEPEVPVDVDSIELPVKEVVKIGWKYYIPSAIATVSGAVCNVESTKEGLKRTAAMIVANQMTEAAFNEYRAKTHEVVGDKKEEEIQNRIVKSKMEQLVDDNGNINSVYDTRDGSTLCFDYWSGRYFYSDIDYIKTRINQLNEYTLNDALADPNTFTKLNDVYDYIGLPQTASAEDLVWRLNKEGLVELRPSSILVDDDRPCWVLNFRRAPVHIPDWQWDRM